MRSATSFLVGVAVGAFTVFLVQRFQKGVLQEDAESLAHRLSRQMGELERRSSLIVPRAAVQES